MEKKIVKIDEYRENISSDMLLTLDPQKAEKAFNKLPLEKMVQVVLSAPWEKRMDIIMLAENSRQLVQALPEEEVYWTVKARGEEDSLALISMTNQEQFQYLVDIDCWDKDRIDINNVEIWYRLLSKCHESKVIEWFEKADDEFLTFSLKKLVNIFKIEEETDISEEYAEMPSYTLDGIYYFKFINNDARLFVMPILNVLYQHNQYRFFSIVEGIIWDFEMESEEEALYWRRTRISEKGFPDLYEAMEIYQYISDNEIKLLLKKGNNSEITKCGVEKNRNSIHLRYAIKFGGIPPFLFNVLQSIGNQQLLEDFQVYVINIATKIITADSLEIKEIKDMERSLKKAAGYINIGLDYISEGNIKKARIFFENIHAANLFRIGYSRVLKLKNQVARNSGHICFEHSDMFLTFFDTPWSDAVSGLMRKRPMFYEGITKKGGVAYRNFESLEEVLATEKIIDLVMAADRLLFDILMLKPEFLISDFVEQTVLKDVSEIKCTSVFLTILANNILNGKSELRPVTANELMDFLGIVFEQVEGQDNFCLKKNIYDETLAWILSLDSFSENFMTGLELFVYACLDMLEEEFSSLVKKKRIDIRYVSGIILKKGT